MRFLVRSTLACLLAAGLAAPVAHAEEVATPALKSPALKTPASKPAGKAAAKASAPSAKPANKDRRPGELEGWDSGLKGPVAVKARRPPDAVSEKTLPDGGLPLPERKLSSDPSSPIGFDKSGNMGSTFKF